MKIQISLLINRDVGTKRVEIAHMLTFSNCMQGFSSRCLYFLFAISATYTLREIYRCEFLSLFRWKFLIAEKNIEKIFFYISQMHLQSPCVIDDLSFLMKKIFFFSITQFFQYYLSYTYTFLHVSCLFIIVLSCFVITLQGIPFHVRTCCTRKRFGTIEISRSVLRWR